MNSSNKTIADFGDQWTTYTDNSGYYGSNELLKDILEPAFAVEDIQDKDVAEIGAGTGRISLMLARAGAKSVTAIEPSAAFKTLKNNLAGTDINCVQREGRDIEGLGPFDIIFSIGVLHHIPEPNIVAQRALNCLRPGGQMVIWLYGHEGNELYLSIFQPLRRLTHIMPDWLLSLLCHALVLMTYPYIWLSSVLPLPLRSYMRRVFGKVSYSKKHLIVFDQLNPQWAKYYRKQEAIDLLKRNGFVDVFAHHRHGYSWTVVGKKA
ncbi:class I SAM-dependent methyltransferase [Thalassospira sp. HF15]|uniref:class I SAM-dependent methyltransferase n=1 Tax=Thalassospira sp. HF15 TaxID=2722755 RepID=UPI00142F559F|nr:class I SAM-dependent methyltransferase [Thalassospira sp. HF15]NIY75419.1 class I SAM-dependent methyltransferase [Thalassospira sp. HF15]